ncbi:hypothetical protein ASZ90_010993 [hydrocarbon metagenome]|uniref:Regulator of amino acid metabolism, contains ACT domain protein n=1 Tax=hydrocarbon metagenome TaxID=938273 RepID=A0A0W8FEK1_9ZZZZ
MPGIPLPACVPAFVLPETDSAFDVYLYAPFPFLDMWAAIVQEFFDSPSQCRVVRFLLENGFGVNDEGRIVCNGIEIPATHIGKAIGVDRRVVDATARHILGTPVLREIFTRLRAAPDLSLVAEALGLSVITILPRDAHQKGIVSAAVRVLVEHDLKIRQIFVTDPYLSEEPKLVMIVDEKPPAIVFEELRALPSVKKLII